jgi:branched-chain amino acid transport system ATP-binding protein
VFRLLPWSEGEVLLEGRPIDRLAPNRILAAGLAYVPQHRSVFPRLTIGENLWMGGYLLNDKALLEKRVRDVEQLFPLLAERRSQLAGTLSGGEQRMLSLARVLVHEPKLLVTDELSLGLAPVIIDEVYRTLATIREHGTSLLIVEQHVHQALTLADDVVVMSKGRVALSGPVQELGDVTESILPAVHGEVPTGNGSEK